MTQKLTCPKCKELREPSWFHNNSAQSSGKSYWCKSCVKAMNSEYKHKGEKFKRNSSACDSKLLDRALAKELKEVYEL